MKILSPHVPKPCLISLKKTLGAVGGNIGINNPVICGGLVGNVIWDKCYKLEDNEWKDFGNMESARSWAASLIINNNLEVFGGFDAMDSMEWINANGQSTGTSALPAKIRNHAMVNVDEKRSMMIGGVVNGEISSKIWFYSHNNKEFTQGPQLKQARSRHAAGVVTDKETGEKIIVVSGGVDPNYDYSKSTIKLRYPLSYLKSTELLIDGTWQQGKMNTIKIQFGSICLSLLHTVFI